MKLRSHQEKRLPGAFEMPAPAKINWALDIVGQREDGYHLLDSLMQPLALCDWLYFQPADTLSLVIEGSNQLEADESNLVLRSANALKAYVGIDRGVRITLEKHIPMGAGLGGGSADAAAALRGLNEWWHLNLDDETLSKIGLKLGADVPFCLLNAPARAQGIGEKLTPVPCARIFPLILIQPCAALSTREVFQGWHRSLVPPSDMEGALQALATGDLDALASCARNGLEPVSLAMRPEIERAKVDLRNSGAIMAQMTGSGSVVFGAYCDLETAKKAYEVLKSIYATCILTNTAF